MYILLKTYTNRELFILLLKDDIEWYHIILEMDTSAVLIFTLSMDSVKVVNSNYINLEIWKFY